MFLDFNGEGILRGALLTFLLSFGASTNMAIYKDYGSPPEFNNPERIAGLVGRTGEYTILGDGINGQWAYGRGTVPPALAVQTAEAPTKFTTTGSTAISLGNIEEIADFTATSGGLSVVFDFIDDTSEESLTILYESDAITAAEDQVISGDGSRSSGNDTFVITAENSNGGGAGDPSDEIVVAISAEGNLTITPGSGITGERVYTLRRLSDFEIITRVKDELLALGDEPGPGDIDAILEKYGLDSVPSLVGGGSFDEYPTNPVDGSWVGWLLSFQGVAYDYVYSDTHTVPISYVDNDGQLVEATATFPISRTSSLYIAGLGGSGETRTASLGQLLGVLLSNWGNQPEAAYQEIYKTVGLVPSDASLNELWNDAYTANSGECFRQPGQLESTDGPNCGGIPFGWSVTYEATWEQVLVTGWWLGNANVPACGVGEASNGCCTECVWPATEVGVSLGLSNAWIDPDDQSGN
jgi:hypothetical protein